MISRFFIDRPVFATVLSIVVMLVGGIAYLRLPLAQYPEVVPPVVQVTATFPGASAGVVAETVAAPLEQEINGVEKMLYINSRSTNDGRMTLDVTFQVGTNLDMAQVLVQNRVSAALARLPEEARRQGVVTKKRSPSILLCVNLVSETSPSTGRELYDQLFLGNYATTRINEALARIDGVGSVEPFGNRDFSMRVWLDPDKMAARKLMPADVLAAIRDQNVQVAAGTLGQPPAPPGIPFEIVLKARGRLTTEDEFEKIILKTGNTTTQTVFLADVLRDSEYLLRIDPRAMHKNGLTIEQLDTLLNGAGHQSAPVPGQIDQLRLKSAANAPWAIPVSIPQAGIKPLRDLLGHPGGITTITRGVELGSKSYSVNSYLDGKESVCVAIYQQPGSNAVETAKLIKDTMHSLKDDFPPGMDYKIVYDTTVFIEESINTVYHTLFEAMLLVLLVVIAFLQDWKVTILPMIEVPVSLVGTFAVMSLLGFSLNNLSLFGLVLAIGIVVDDAIVVIENVERWIAKGYEPKEAARRAMDETTGAVIAIAIVLAAVFIPTAFLTGISGQFFRQFALTIAGATLISAMNALTMTPARCALIMKAHNHHGPREAPLPNWAMPLAGLLGGWLVFGLTVSALLAGPAPLLGPWGKVIAGAAGLLVGIGLIRPVNAFLLIFFQWFNKVIGRAMDTYASLVGWLARRALMLAVVYLLLLSFTGWGFSRLPSGFIPDQDKGYLLMAAQMPEGASLGRTDAFVRKLEQEARLDPAVDHVLALPGFSLLASSNISEAGALFVILKPFEERAKNHAWSAAGTRKRLAEKMASELDGLALVFGSPPVDGLGSTGGFKLQVEDVAGVGPEALAQAVRDMEKAALGEPKLAGLMSTFSNSQPQYFLEFDREKARASGVSLENIFTTLTTYLGGMYVNDITLYGRNWQVNVQADAKFRLRKEDLRLLLVRSSAGKMVPLGTLLTVIDDNGPAIVSRYNLRGAAALNGAPAPGISSGEAMAAVEKLASNNLGGSMRIEWTELSLLERLAAQDWINLLIFPLGVIFVYLALAAQYESYTLPIAILLIVPMCLLSAWVGLVCTGLDNNLFVQIGLVVLVALAAKNAILIVEFAKQQEDSGKPRVEAVVEACKMRLRPILMTSLAFILGVVPLVFSHGAGAEMRQAIGITVFSGMLGVTFFGLLFTPVFYVLVRQYLSSKSTPSSASPKPVPVPQPIIQAECP